MDTPSSAPKGSSAKTLAQLRSQVLEQARREPAPTRAGLAAKQRTVAIVALVVPLLIFGALGGVRLGPRPSELALMTALGSALLAGAAAIFGFARGRSMLGRPRAWLLGVALLTPSLLFTWRSLVSSHYPDMMAQWSERPGLRCLLLSGALSLAPLAGALWLRRGTDPVHPHLSAAGIGATVGAGSWVLVDLWCPVGYVPHVLLGHVAPLVLVVLISALFGGRILAQKRAALARVR
jgi:hypothetical protein